MKKILLLLPVLALAACDKPTSSADLVCRFDPEWKRDNTEYFQDAAGKYVDAYDTKVNVTVATYDKYAKVTVDNITTTFEKVKESKDRGDFGDIWLIYKGNFPGSERTALLRVHGDITEKQIFLYDFVFPSISQKHSTLYHSCYTVNDAKVPFNHHYRMPNKTEKCINEIVNKVWCKGNECEELMVWGDIDKRKTLTPQEALALSKNWDYSNMKLYQNDGKLEKHERDACDVLERVNKFIRDNNLKKDD